MLNGHENHKSFKFNIFYKNNNIITLYLPTYLLYLFYPFNIRYFNPLKWAYNRELKGFIKSHINHIIKTEFFITFYTVYIITITL